MRIKVSNDVIYGIDRGLAQIQSSGKELGGKLVYSIVKNRKMLSNTIKSTEEAKKSIWDKYVEKDKDGQYKIDEKKNKYIFKTKEDEKKAIDEFQKVLDDIVEQEVHAINVDDINIDINFNETVEGPNGHSLRFSHVPLVFEHLVQNGDVKE